MANNSAVIHRWPSRASGKDGDDKYPQRIVAAPSRAYGKDEDDKYPQRIVATVKIRSSEKKLFWKIFAD